MPVPLKNAIIFTLQCLVLNAVNSQGVDHLSYHEIGDTFHVLAKSGLTLRDGQSVHARAITTVPFGSSVIALAGPGEWEEIDGRTGCWIMVRYGDLEGHAFSGYLTKMIVPEFKADPLFLCYNLQWFEIIARANADSLVYEGGTLKKGYDPDGKDWSKTEWEVFRNGTIIQTAYGYESKYMIVETSSISMNDVLNILEYYVSILNSKCSDWQWKENQLEIITTRNTWAIERIECSDMGFTAWDPLESTCRHASLSIL